MPLSESQIQRYARHILLPEVGGVGQEKLLAAEVRVRGERDVTELAGNYLSAAGVRVDAHSGPGLELQVGDRGVTVRADGTQLTVVSSHCNACRGSPSGPLPLESGSIAAALAASEALRLILEIGPDARAWRITGAKLAHDALPACTHAR